MKVRKCIIPIAGKGTRRLPITKTVSKEMLPIVNEPGVMLIVEECLKSGIEEIIFVVNEDNCELVKSFFSQNLELESFLESDSKKASLRRINEIISKMKFHYVIQNEKVRGSAGAVYAARDYIKDEYFAVAFGDDLFDSDEPIMKKLIEECEKNNCNVIGVREVEEKLKSYYHLIKYKKDNIMECFSKTLEEKKLSSNDMMIGRLVINSTVFDKILQSECHDGYEYYLPDVLVTLKEEIRTIKCTSNYYNIGNTLGYIKANISFGLKNENIKEDLLDFIKNVEN